MYSFQFSPYYANLTYGQKHQPKQVWVQTFPLVIITIITVVLESNEFFRFFFLEHGKRRCTLASVRPEPWRPRVALLALFCQAAPPEQSPLVHPSLPSSSLQNIHPYLFK